MLILLDNAAGQVLADPAGFLRLHWGGQPRPFAATCAIFDAAAEGLRRYGWGRILVNQTAMMPFLAQEQAWISRQWLPVAVRDSGYRVGAVVVATNVLTRLATSSITTSAPALPLRYRSFDTEALAISWLLRQPV